MGDTAIGRRAKNFFGVGLGYSGQNLLEFTHIIIIMRIKTRKTSFLFLSSRHLAGGDIKVGVVGRRGFPFCFFLLTRWEMYSMKIKLRQKSIVLMKKGEWGC